MSNGSGNTAEFWRIMRLPLQLLALGVALFLLFMLARVALPATAPISFAQLNQEKTAQLAVGTLIFLTGVVFTAFVWWLSARFLKLLGNDSLTAEKLAAIKDLPMGLPDGTVRAFLAMIVAVVGLPILLFSEFLNLNDAIAGYVNGIIIGVFSFYFGSKTAGVPEKAVNQIADERARTVEAQKELDTVKAEVEETVKVKVGEEVGAVQAENEKVRAENVEVRAESDALKVENNVVKAENVAGQIEKLADTLTRQAGLIGALREALGEDLASSVLPEGVDDILAKAKSGLDLVKGVAAGSVSEAQIADIEASIVALVGGEGAGESPLGGLLRKAIPVIGSVAGFSPLAPLAVVLSLGFNLGSAEYQRWRTRVLAAPLAPGLIQTGTITPVNALTALEQAPLLAAALAPVSDEPGFGATLADLAVREDALDLLPQKFPNAPLLQGQEQAEAALRQFQQVLLAQRAGNDVTDAAIQQSVAGLGSAVLADLRPPEVTRQDGDALIERAASGSADAAVPAQARAAFDALVMLVGLARSNGLDLKAALGEIVR